MSAPQETTGNESVPRIKSREVAAREVGSALPFTVGLAAVSALTISKLFGAPQTTPEPHAQQLNENQVVHLTEKLTLEPEDVTVDSRLTASKASKIFGCEVQNNFEMTPSHNQWATPKQQKCAQKIAFVIGNNSFGWGKSQMKSLKILWDHESQWSANAANPTSSAKGIPQGMTSDQLYGPLMRQEYGVGKYDYLSNTVSQIQWGLGYIDNRYSNPTEALHFWRSNCDSDLGCWY